MKLCIICSSELIGRQRKFCSTSCQAKDFRNRNPQHSKIKSKEYYYKNRESELLKRKKYYKENSEAIKKRAMDYHWENREDIIKRKKIYSRIHYSENAEYYKEKNKKWKLENPGKMKSYKRIYRSTIALSKEHFTAEDVKWLFIDQEGYCAYCNADIEENYHIDHIIPVSRGGSNGRGNIALACPSCNLRKHNKTAEEFMEVI
jgi:5-methylcytosine-specific restriction endonuclease McrA